MAAEDRRGLLASDNFEASAGSGDRHNDGNIQIVYPSSHRSRDNNRGGAHGGSWDSESPDLSSRGSPCRQSFHHYHIGHHPGVTPDSFSSKNPCCALFLSFRCTQWLIRFVLM